MCDCGRGEEIDRVVLFVPRLGERGKVVAYEERVKGGAVLRDLSGKRIGTRYADLRSRGTNARNQGLTIEEIRQHLQITN